MHARSQTFLQGTLVLYGSLTLLILKGSYCWPFALLARNRRPPLAVMNEVIRGRRIPPCLQVWCLLMQCRAITVPSRPSLEGGTALTLLRPTIRPLATANRLLPATWSEPSPAAQHLDNTGGRTRRTNEAPQSFRCFTRARTIRPIMALLRVVVTTDITYCPRTLVKWMGALERLPCLWSPLRRNGSRGSLPIRITVVSWLTQLALLL